MIVDIMSRNQIKEYIEHEVYLRTEYLEEELDKLKAKIIDLERIGGNI